MARVIDDLPSGSRRRRYPWDEWLDGRARELVRGEDYTADTSAMRTMIYMAASKRGVKVTVYVDGDTISFQAREVQS